MDSCTIGRANGREQATPSYLSESVALRRVLMVCHDFPPCLSPGTFRALRFSKYLPEHGWQPVVLSLEENNLPDYVTRDPALLAQVATDLPVIRTSAWRPVKWLEQVWKRIRRSSPERVHGDVQAVHSGGNSAPEGLLRNSAHWLHQGCRQFLELTCGTPDEEISWFLPAVYRGLATIRKYQPQLIYTTGPPHSANLIGTALHQLTGIPHVVDLRDPWSRVPWGTSGGRFRQLILRQLEEACVRRAALVILNTQRICREFREYYHYLPSDRFQTVMNGFDPDLLTQIDELTQTGPGGESGSDQQFPNGEPTLAMSSHADGPRGRASSPQRGTESRPCEWAAQRTWTICHPGHIYGQRSLWPLIDAIRAVRQEGWDVRLRQIGHVEEAQQAALLAEADVREFLVIEPEVPHAELMQQLAQADGLVILQQGTALQVPSKLFEMMLFHKPLLAIVDEGETADIIRQYGLGCIASAQHPQEVQQALRSLITGRWMESIVPLWPLARDAFNGRALTAQLAIQLDRLIGPPSPHSY